MTRLGDRRPEVAALEVSVELKEVGDELNANTRVGASVLRAALAVAAALHIDA